MPWVHDRCAKKILNGTTGLTVFGVVGHPIYLHLFGRLLYLNTHNSIDLIQTFSCPLIPVPSVANIDRSMQKIDKAKLLVNSHNQWCSTCVWYIIWSCYHAYTEVDLTMSTIVDLALYTCHHPRYKILSTGATNEIGSEFVITGP